MLLEFFCFCTTMNFCSFFILLFYLILKKFSFLRDINLIIYSKFLEYKIVMFAMAKIMEMEQSEINKIALYLFNSINSKKSTNYLINVV